MQKKARIGAYSDIYSLGMTLYKLLSLENPPLIAGRLDDRDFQKSIDNLSVSNGFKDIIKNMTDLKVKNRISSLNEIENYFTHKKFLDSMKKFVIQLT